MSNTAEDYLKELADANASNEEKLECVSEKMETKGIGFSTACCRSSLQSYLPFLSLVQTFKSGRQELPKGRPQVSSVETRQ
jgi:hypothetical protein